MQFFFKKISYIQGGPKVLGTVILDLQNSSIFKGTATVWQQDD